MSLASREMSQVGKTYCENGGSEMSAGHAANWVISHWFVRRPVVSRWNITNCDFSPIGRERGTNSAAIDDPGISPVSAFFSRPRSVAYAVPSRKSANWVLVLRWLFSCSRRRLFSNVDFRSADFCLCDSTLWACRFVCTDGERSADLNT